MSFGSLQAVPVKATPKGDGLGSKPAGSADGQPGGDGENADILSWK